MSRTSNRRPSVTPNIAFVAVTHAIHNLLFIYFVQFHSMNKFANYLSRSLFHNKHKDSPPFYRINYGQTTSFPNYGQIQRLGLGAPKIPLTIDSNSLWKYSNLRQLHNRKFVNFLNSRHFSSSVLLKSDVVDINGTIFTNVNFELTSSFRSNAFRSFKRDH
jgi:hypothetical protein